MSVTTNGFVACLKGDRYLKQLASHWKHKMDASYDAGCAVFPFPSGAIAEMQAEAEGIAIRLTASDQQENEHKRGVIERHLDRFAFGEAPLTYSWQEQAA